MFLIVVGLNDYRKDRYSVFAEPVDPEEVCGIFLILLLEDTT